MKKNLPPIALQLSHPEACFYCVGLSESTVSGLFQAHDNDQPFEIGFQEFLESCYKCGILDDVQGGTVYIVGDRTDRNARQWAADWLQENAGTTDFHAVLADAVRSEFDAEMCVVLAELQRATPATIVERINKEKDTAFCDAVAALADIIRTNEEYKQDVKDANEPQSPPDPADLVKELAVDVLAMGGVSAAVVLNTLAGSMYAGQDRALAQLVVEYNEKVLLPYVKAGIAAKRAAQN